MKALPIFFRTIESVKPSYDELKELVENLKKEEPLAKVPNAPCY